MGTFRDGERININLDGLFGIGFLDDADDSVCHQNQQDHGGLDKGGDLLALCEWRRIIGINDIGIDCNGINDIRGGD